MLIDIANTHESSGLTKVCDFQIQTNGIMVKALTSRLYSNPISSVVRELASNALDANRSEPMEIHVPTLLDPSFRIRDKGPGLSRTSMVEVFTRFGESTKRNTNSQIGGFGLGAKSPFAIANSYTVVSSHAGTKTTYLASIGSDGMPALHEVSSQPTNDTGLEIIVPAKPSPAWVEALSQIQFFEPRPIIQGCTFEFPNVIYDTPNYLVVSGGKPSVLVGPVAYPLNVSHFDYGVPPFAFKFPIGTLEVTASREEIVYSTATKNVITAALKSARAHYSAVVSDMIVKCKTAPEVWQVLEGSIFTQTFNFTTPSGRKYEIDKDCVMIDVQPLRKYDRHGRRRKSWRSSHSTSVRLCVEDVVYLGDDMRKMQERIENTLMNQPNFKHNTDVYVVSDRTPFDDLGIPVIPLSSIPTASPVRNAPRPISHRGINTKDKLQVSSQTCTHYLLVDNHPNLEKRVMWRGVNLTFEIYEAMCHRIGGRISIVAPNFKGKLDGLTDAAPVWDAAVAHFLATDSPAIVNYHWYTNAIDNWDKPLYAALAAHGLVPPVPPRTSISFSTQGADIIAYHDLTKSAINYKQEYQKVISANPHLRLLDSRSWETSHTNALISLISLIK